MAARSCSVGGGGVSDTEFFWSLVDKADRKFSKARVFPIYSRTRSDPDFHKAFKIYTRLWKLQQENRQKLVEAGLKRWEIGEIASRIAQLYYVQYQRTGDLAHLFECYIFNEAVLNREYFKEGLMQEPALANKQLRFLARFLVVCLLLGRRTMVVCLADMIKQLVDDCKKNSPELELAEWKQAVHNIVRFRKADSTFMNMRPFRYSYFHDSHPDSLPSLVSSEKKWSLSDALLCSYRQNEIKFSEITLDTFRMLQSLEWEPCGSFNMPGGPGTSESQYGHSHLTHWQDIRDPTLPPNPRKVLLHRPSITDFLLVLATMCKELPPNGILLIYLSAKGKEKPTLPLQPVPSGITVRDIEGNLNSLHIAKHSDPPPVSTSKLSNKDIDKSQNNEQDCCLWLGSQDSEGSGCLYPCDLIPFTRKPLFIIIDSDVSYSFKAMHGFELVETVAILLSPRSEPTSVISNTGCAHGQNGSLFTMFLTAPLQAFCFLSGVPNTNIDLDTFEKSEKLLLSALNEWERILISSDSLNHVWMHTLVDPFLRRLLLRFIFCRAVLALNAATHGQPELLPDCLPALPNSVLPESPVSKSAIKELAEYFNVTEQFALLEQCVLPDGKAENSPTAESQ